MVLNYRCHENEIIRHHHRTRPRRPQARRVRAGRQGQDPQAGNHHQQPRKPHRAEPQASRRADGHGGRDAQPVDSRFLEDLGHRVLVANPRKVRAIYQNNRKCDRKDAEMLARIARTDESLLHPVEHGTEETQRDLLQIKLRDNLVRQRVDIIARCASRSRAWASRWARPTPPALPTYEMRPSRRGASADGSLNPLFPAQRGAAAPHPAERTPARPRLGRPQTPVRGLLPSRPPGEAGGAPCIKLLNNEPQPP